MSDTKDPIKEFDSTNQTSVLEIFLPVLQKMRTIFDTFLLKSQEISNPIIDELISEQFIRNSQEFPSPSIDVSTSEPLISESQEIPRQLFDDLMDKLRSEQLRCDVLLYRLISTQDQLTEALNREIELERAYKKKFREFAEKNERTIADFTSQIADLTSEIKELKEARKRKISFPKSWVQDILNSFDEGNED